jgi:hypothetical protein
LSSDVLDLQVTEHGTDARVVIVGGEIDALTAPELDALLTAQLAAASLVVDLELSAILGVCWVVCAVCGQWTRGREIAACGWCFPNGAWSIAPLR